MTQSSSNNTNRRLPWPLDRVSTRWGQPLWPNRSSSGYATTIHAAQGVTSDAMHGLVTGQESRQQLYTMLTRGRAANHLYLQVVGDGDPHTVIRREIVSPHTPTEMLEQIWPATTHPLSHHPAPRTQRPRRPATTRRFSGTPTACTSPPNTSSDPAPSRHSRRSRPGRARGHRRNGLADPAGGLDRPRRGDRPASPDPPPPSRPRAGPQHRRRHGRRSRLAPPRTSLHLRTGTAALAPRNPPSHPRPPEWDDYLAKRARLIEDLAHDVRHHALRDSTQPAWTPPGRPITPALIGNIEVWRAANGINPHDHRPTGPEQLQTASIEWRHRLEQSIAQATNDSVQPGPTRRKASPTTVQGRPRDPQAHTPYSPDANERLLPPSPGR